MDKSLIPALLAATASIAGAIWSLLTAHRARRNVLRAEEHAKRAELVRVKALEAIDTLLDGLTTLILSVETMCFLMRANVSIDSTPGPMKDFAEARGKVTRLRYRFAPYVSDEVLSMIDELVQMTTSIAHDREELDRLSSRLRLLASKIASEARASYLAEA
jgi:hypothetical protein